MNSKDHDEQHSYQNKKESQHPMTRRRVLKAGALGVATALAGCHGDDSGNPGDPGNPGGPSIPGDPGTPDDPNPGPIPTTQIGSSGPGSLTIRDGPNLHVASMNSTYTIYRSEQPLNDEYIYFAEIESAFTPKQGGGYKGNLVAARVTVEAVADDLELLETDPDGRRVIDPRDRKENYKLKLSVRKSGASVGYSNSYRTHDGVIYRHDVQKGQKGDYTLGWKRGNADVYTPITFHGLVTFRSEKKRTSLAGWRIGHLGRAEADQNLI